MRESGDPPSPARPGRFRRDEAGATAIEYAIIAAGLSIAITVTVSNVGSEVAGMFSSVMDGFR